MEKHISFAALILLQVFERTRGLSVNNTANITNSLKIRNNVVDETFLEQKDVLLDMLEAKLKEVRDKKRSHRSSNKADVKLNAHGIVAMGETDIQLKYGDNGNSNLNLNATGISNVGKIRLDMAAGALNLPGLDTLFNGPDKTTGTDNQYTNSETNSNTTSKLEYSMSDKMSSIKPLHTGAGP